MSFFLPIQTLITPGSEIKIFRRGFAAWAPNQLVLEMTQLQSLKSATSLHSIAALLHFKPKALAFLLYKEPASTKYQTFDISKRGGGVRKISAPLGGLKLLQKRLSNLLQDCVEEINTTNKWNDEFAHGFKRHRSIITNASKHFSAGTFQLSRTTTDINGVATTIKIDGTLPQLHGMLGTSTVWIFIIENSH